jgi:hypothetical protein
MMACAAIPAQGSEVEAKLLAPSASDSAPVKGIGHGMEPEAATPPPRTA